MKPFPNNPDEAALTARLAEDRQKFEALPADAPGKKADYYDAGCRLAFGLASLSYALEKPVAEVKSFAVHATRYAHRAVACDGLMDPSTFQRYLALAIWTTDTNFRGRLANFDRAQFTNPDGPPFDDVVYKVTEALADLSRRRPEMAAEHAAAGLKRIARGLVATAVVNRTAPLLRIAQAIGKGDLYTYRGAISERTTQYLRVASTDATRNDPEMLIDLVGLAFVRIAAADYGLSVDPKSVFMPVSGLI